MVNNAGGEIINEGSFDFEVRTGLLGDNDDVLNHGKILNRANGTIDINRLINDGQIAKRHY